MPAAACQLLCTTAQIRLAVQQARRSGVTALLIHLLQGLLQVLLQGLLKVLLQVLKHIVKCW